MPAITDPSRNLLAQFEARFGDLNRWVGVALILQAAITLHAPGLIHLGVPGVVVSGALGVVGAFLQYTGKKTDSTSDIAKFLATLGASPPPITPPTLPPFYTPPAAPATPAP